MATQCPFRHPPVRQRARFHHAAPGHARRRRAPLHCSQPVSLPHTTRGLSGSFDPVWTARAEGEFIGGAFRTRSNTPVFVIARVLVLIAVLSWCLAPLSSVSQVLGNPGDGSHPGAQALIIIYLAVLALAAGSRLVRSGGR